MPRDPRAATTLISELRRHAPRLAVERGAPDGLGVVRTFRLTSSEVKGLADVVNVVADARIVQSRALPAGVEVTFTHYVTADSGAPFGVMDAADLFSSVRKPRKRATKKTAKKAAPKSAG